MIGFYSLKLLCIYVPYLMLFLGGILAFRHKRDWQTGLQLGGGIAVLIVVVLDLLVDPTVGPLRGAAREWSPTQVLATRVFNGVGLCLFGLGYMTQWLVSGKNRGAGGS